MRCTNSEIGKLLARYELDLVSAQERKRFEAHLLNCDACFHEYYAMSGVVQFMADNRQALLEAVGDETGEKARQPVRLDLAEIWVRLKAVFAPSGHPGWRVAGAAALVLLVVFVLVPVQQEFADLAVVEPVQYQKIAFRLKGAPEPQAWQEIFGQGMVAYERGEYDRAVTDLSKALALNPEHAEITFYLGLSYLLSARPDSAVVTLRRLAGIRSAFWREQGLWVLGNAYLQTGEVENARQTLRQVVALDGAHSESAAALLSAIEQRENEFVLTRKLKKIRRWLGRSLKH